MKATFIAVAGGRSLHGARGHDLRQHPRHQRARLLDVDDPQEQVGRGRHRVAAQDVALDVGEVDVAPPAALAARDVRRAAEHQNVERKRACSVGGVQALRLDGEVDHALAQRQRLAHLADGRARDRATGTGPGCDLDRAHARAERAPCPRGPG